MLYLFSALYCEVQPLIRALALKKHQPDRKAPEARSVPFQQFTNEAQDILLTLTGPGPAAASAAAAAVLSLQPPSGADLLLSFGSCAAPLPGEAHSAQGIYRLVKLLDFASRRSFYPDLLYPSHFPEAGCLSFARILNLSSESDAWQTEVLEAMQKEHCRLYDMEAAAVYQAGSHFLGPHQMHFLRIVSDPGEGRTVKPEDISRMVEQALPHLLPEIEALQCRIRQEKEKPALFTEKDEALFERLRQDLCCSVVMTAQLRQLLRYLSLAELPWQSAATALYQNGTLPCRNKKQGKEVLDAFRKQFLF